MPEFTLGRLKFERNWRGSKDSAEQIIAIHDCAPPPRGSRLNGNPATQWPVDIQSAFLQPSEIGRIVAGATVPAGPSDITAILASVMNNLDMTPLAVDINLVPSGWHGITPCMRTTIAYVVQYQIIDVDVTTTVDATFGNETYPAGDRVASFRVLDPRRYQFVRRHQHNPACCPGAHVAPATEQSDWFPISERDIRIYIDPGLDWKSRWDLTPRLEYKFYEGEGQAPEAPDDDKSPELDDLKRKLRELEEKLRKLSEGTGN
ncbi:hypothetical protein [Emcibacter sp. SYSU 3D8]|uniref:hypothetical protein n=1 Tax=Emcibacter sp. SYSU 3D8 TaxID=3133969 RepID=UPI0031FF154F